MLVDLVTASFVTTPFTSLPFDRGARLLQAHQGCEKSGFRGLGPPRQLLLVTVAYMAVRVREKGIADDANSTDKAALHAVRR